MIESCTVHSLLAPQCFDNSVEVSLVQTIAERRGEIFVLQDIIHITNPFQWLA